MAAAIFANDRRAAAQRLAIAPFILILAVLPWGIRNFTVLGSFAWLSTNGGVTLYDAQGPQADGSSNQTFLDLMPELEPLGEVERDRRLRSLAVEEMQRDPAHVMQLAAAKFARTWNPFPNVAEYRSGGAAWIGASHALILYALAAGALFVVRGRGWLARLAVLLGPCVYFAVLHAVYIGSVRYRVPVMPLLAVMGAGVFAALDRRGAAAR